MRLLIAVALFGAVVVFPRESEAQIQGSPTGPYGGGTGAYYGFNPAYYRAPGYYGMAWGFPAYGFPRTYTAFSSPYGAGYRYGYGPYTYMWGRYGVGLWRPGFIAPGYAFGASSYRTFPLNVPYGSLTPGNSPPVGVYAPYFGPPAFVAR
jgi:hypothetical protein